MRHCFILLFLSLILNICNAQKIRSLDCNSGPTYRIKHILLEMSSWFDYPIVESIPRLINDIDSVRSSFNRIILSKTDEKGIYARFPLKFIIRCDGTISDTQSLARIRQDIADSLLIEMMSTLRWLPGTVSKIPVNTVIICTVVMSGKNTIIELPTTENESRLPSKNISFAGTWIQYKKDIGSTDTLRLTGSTYEMIYGQSGQINKLMANIVEHQLDSGRVKLKIQHQLINSLEVPPPSEYIYFVYASTKGELFSSQDITRYPNKNLLEYNATCRTWRKEK